MWIGTRLWLEGCPQAHFFVFWKKTHLFSNGVFGSTQTMFMAEQLAAGVYLVRKNYMYFFKKIGVGPKLTILIHVWWIFTNSC